MTLKGYSTFLGNRLILPFYRFQIHSDGFLIFRRTSVTRQFLVPLTSIVGKIYTMEVTETRNCLVTDILLNIKKKLAEYIKKR